MFPCRFKVVYALNIRLLDWVIEIIFWQISVGKHFFKHIEYKVHIYITNVPTWLNSYDLFSIIWSKWCWSHMYNLIYYEAYIFADPLHIISSNIEFIHFFTIYCKTVLLSTMSFSYILVFISLCFSIFSFWWLCGLLEKEENICQEILF